MGKTLSLNLIYLTYFSHGHDDIILPFYTNSNTAKITVISPNLLVWKFCGKEQFPYSFGRFAWNYAENVSFRKISTPELRWNYGIFCSVSGTLVNANLGHSTLIYLANFLSTSLHSHGKMKLACGKTCKNEAKIN